MVEKITRQELRTSRKKARLEGVATRQEERRQRSPSQQLARLDTLFGKGQGASKERVKLQKEIT